MKRRTDSEMPVLVIGVNYRTDEHAEQFVRSLCQHSSQAVSVILVDNSEREDWLGFERSILGINPNVRCIAAPRNLGYFGGADFGLMQYKKDAACEPDWVVVCNVDIEFSDDSFFQRLQGLGMEKTLGVVAPRIWSARWNRDLNPKIQQRPERKQILFYQAVFNNYYLQLAYEALSFFKNGARSKLRQFVRRTENKTEVGQRTRIYAPHGSCIIFHREYFAKGGTLQYAVFLFGEEIFVAEINRQLGLHVEHYPELWVLDKEHASTGIIRSRRIAGYMKDATNYLVANYFA